MTAAAAAKSLQSCLTLCDPTDSSPPGFPVPGILQARTLEWVTISLSNAWKWKVKVKSLSRVWLFATPRTAAHQAPPSMGFSRQEYWSGVPLPCPGKPLGSCKCEATDWGDQWAFNESHDFILHSSFVSWVILILIQSFQNSYCLARIFTHCPCLLFWII